MRREVECKGCDRIPREACERLAIRLASVTGGNPRAIMKRAVREAQNGSVVKGGGRY